MAGFAQVTVLRRQGRRRGADLDSQAARPGPGARGGVGQAVGPVPAALSVAPAAGCYAGCQCRCCSPPECEKVSVYSAGQTEKCNLNLKYGAINRRGDRGSVMY